MVVIFFFFLLYKRRRWINTNRFSATTVDGVGCRCFSRRQTLEDLLNDAYDKAAKEQKVEERERKEPDAQTRSSLSSPAAEEEKEEQRGGGGEGGAGEEWRRNVTVASAV